MPVMEAFGINAKPRIRIEDHQVGVAAHSNRSLSVLQTGQACRSFAHPPDDMAQSIAAQTGFRPHRGQADLERRNSTPRVQEVAFLEKFAFRKAW